ncbi:MAG: DUF1217 domain-containing protein [Hyphomicrobiales bacterium]|nr:DUF1217 domain-containing protein [Hyphomicrobiales bacterium]
MTTLSSYLTVANNLAKWQQITAKSAAVTTQTKYFQANIGSVKSAADLVKNPRLFNYAMTAYGLGDRTYAKALMSQVLQQGVSSSTALANKLNDPKILAFAKAFNFASNGAQTTSSSTLVSNVVAAYTENQLETDQGQSNPGVQLALYFQRNAPKVTSAYGLLADKQLLQVAQTALGISSMTSVEPIDTQAKMLAAKINFADFQDPAKLQKFISRFAAMYDSNNPNAGSGSAPANALSLSFSQGAGAGLNDMRLMTSMLGYRSF